MCDINVMFTDSDVFIASSQPTANDTKPQHDHCQLIHSPQYTASVTAGEYWHTPEPWWLTAEAHHTWCWWVVTRRWSHFTCVHHSSDIITCWLWLRIRCKPV